MYQLNRDIRVAGYVINHSTEQPEPQFGRPAVYQITLEPENPYFGEEFFQAIYSEIGPQCEPEELAAIQRSVAGSIRFESILPPSVTCCLNSGKLVDVSCRFELATTSDGVHWYLNPQFSFVDEHVRDEPVVEEDEDETHCF